MYGLIFITVALTLGLASTFGYMKRSEIIANWSQYRENPLFLFTAFLFKPDDDPQSSLSFAVNNFNLVIGGIVLKSFSVFFQPLLKLFSGMMGGVEQSANGIMNMRGLFTNMFQKFSSVTNIFQRRYNNTFNALRITFLKLRESMNKTFGAAVASLYAGAATFRAIDNSVRFMTIVAITILSILLVFTVLFFFVLFPILPLIAIALNFVLQTPYASSASGMQEAFCFAPHTQVSTPTGPKAIQDIVLGDVLLHDDGTTTRVLGTMKLNGDYEPLYDLYGVQVSGAHIYYEQGRPVFVKDTPAAIPTAVKTEAVHCLITEDHKIPVLSNQGTLTFADWEEIETTADLEAWNATVFATLNPEAPPAPVMSDSLHSEAAVSEKAFVYTPLGPVQIKNIVPGTSVYDVEGRSTEVTGVVALDASQIKSALKLDESAYISVGTWFQQGTLWIQPQTGVPPPDTQWYMLFTKSGTFRILTDDFHDYAVRDFSDIGADNLPSTYASTLEALVIATAH
jgi:hypothetical protein